MPNSMHSSTLTHEKTCDRFWRMLAIAVYCSPMYFPMPRIMLTGRRLPIQKSSAGVGTGRIPKRFQWWITSVQPVECSGANR